MNTTERRVLITGANRGLGLGFTTRYLEEGWAVIATARTPETATELLAVRDRVGERLMLQPLDVTRERSVTELAARLAGEDLHLDLVISNAGLAAAEEFGDWTAATFEALFRVNTVGPALLAQALAPLMREGAVLVNMSSGMGSMALNINPAGPLDAYAMTKAALNILSLRLATKLRGRGITVVAMNPGWVQTEMGGAEAPLTVAEAVRQATATIETLTTEHTGRYLSNTGDEIPW